MTDKHTPGPWTAGRTNAGSTCVWLNSEGEPSTGLGPDGTWIDCNTKANARLISAAPEMLEALKLLMTAHGEQLDLAFQTAQEAISRATGVPWPEA